MRTTENHFPYPKNDLLEGNTSLSDPQTSEIIAADAAILNGDAPTEPMRRFTAPSVGGEGDIIDRTTEEFHIPTPVDTEDRADVGMIDLSALRGRLAETAAKQMAGRVGRPMHVDGRIPGQVPNVDARPHIPAGAKPSKLAEMHRQFGTER